MIDRSGSALTTIDGQVYRPTRIVATEMLAAAPAEALATYRLWADGEARGLVADPDKSIDAEALDQVVRRFFLSNIGEQAAFRLGCLAMDREDYVQARRLFNLIPQTPRDPGVDRGQVFIRLAFACARLDDRPGVQPGRRRSKALHPIHPLSP